MRFERMESLSWAFPAWGAKIGGYNFIITEQPEGYGASWKDATDRGPQGAKEINGSFDAPFATLAEAERACFAQYRKMRDAMQ